MYWAPKRRASAMLARKSLRRVSSVRLQWPLRAMQSSPSFRIFSSMRSSSSVGMSGMTCWVQPRTAVSSTWRKPAFAMPSSASSTLKP